MLAGHTEEVQGLRDRFLRSQLGLHSTLPLMNVVQRWVISFLRGEVTGIGGLKEKLLAAHRGGIKTVMIPEENVKDLQDIPENVKNRLEIIPVRWIDRVLEVALEALPQPLPDEETPKVETKPEAATVAAATPGDLLTH